MIRQEEILVTCSQCGKKLGALTLFYRDEFTVTGYPMCCMDCLPKRLLVLENGKYRCSQETISRTREWAGIEE